MSNFKVINIKGLEQFCISDKGIVKNNNDKIIKTYDRNGYECIKLLNKNYSIHRLVALTFLEIDVNRKIVNHKNGNKKDNNVTNLEWCTYKENSQHALEKKLLKPFKRKVLQYSYDGKTLLNEYNSIREAEEKTCVGNRLISQVCRNQKPTAHGFVWKYKEELKNETIEEIKGIKIKDFPNYKATKDGNIYSIRSKKFIVPNNTKEYYTIKLCNKGIQKDFYIHKLIAEYFVPNPLNKKIVTHINGNKKDNNYNNLQWI
jgi:hypothetical protein